MSEVRFEVDEKSLSLLNKFLLQLSDKAPKALRSAINTTASKARKDLRTSAKAEYKSAQARSIQGAMTLRRATQANLTATIDVKGRPMLVQRGFKATTPKRGAKVSVKGSLKELVGPSGIRGFGYNGMVLQRKTAARRPLRAPVGPSVPNMMRPEGPVYQRVEPTIQSELQKNVEAQVSKILRG